VAKRDNIIDYGLLEFSLREHLNKVAQRRMAVLDPVKVIIDNYPEGQTEMLTAVNNPENEADGTRQVPFSRELYIEREDFMEVAPKKYFRMAIGQEVRLRYAYFVTAQSVEKDAEGNITCIHCTYDPATRGGDAPDGRKVKGTIHWVSAKHAIDAEVRLFDRLFAVEAPDDVEEGHTFLENLNPNSLRVVTAKCEQALAEWKVESGKWNDGIVRYQFERMGYFCTDRDSTPEHLVFNRTCTLKDSWAKIK
jgi:glutaminyl-tRNA synthetase